MPRSPGLGLPLACPRQTLLLVLTLAPTFSAGLCVVSVSYGLFALVWIFGS